MIGKSQAAVGYTKLPMYGERGSANPREDAMCSGNDAPAANSPATGVQAQDVSRRRFGDKGGRETNAVASFAN